MDKESNKGKDVAPSTGSDLEPRITITGDGNAIGFSNTTSVTKKTYVTEGGDIANFMMLFAQMRQALLDENLSQEDRKGIEADLHRIELEAKKEKPSLATIEEKLDNTESIIRHVLGIGSKLVPIVVRLGELAQQVFR